MRRTKPEKKAKEGKPVLDVLFSRRPDLANLELTCGNTNSILPYIDLVLEILENHVSPFGFDFSDSDLMKDFEQSEFDEKKGEVSENIRCEFKQQKIILSDKAKIIRVLDQPKWHIRDTNCRYCVVLEQEKLSVVSRGFQTTKSTEKAPISPVNTHQDAYDVLKKAKRPWSLPFDRSTEIVRAHLQQLKLSRWQLQRTFHPSQGKEALLNPQFVGELLSLATENEIGYLTASANDVNDFYRTPFPAAAKRTLNSLLMETGLSYQQFTDLLKTRFASRNGELFICADEGSDALICNTEELTLNQFDPLDAQRIHAFVRLWRRIGWRMRELDQALQIFSSRAATKTPLTPRTLEKISHVQLLKQILDVEVLPLLCVWGEIETYGDFSFYYELF